LRNLNEAFDILKEGLKYDEENKELIMLMKEL
jgi:hypothetical protein